LWARLRSSARSLSTEFSEFERLREVVVGAELEPGGLVVEPVGSVSMRIGSPAEATMRFAISSPEAGDVTVEDGDVVALRSAAPERCDRHLRVCRDRFQA